MAMAGSVSDLMLAPGSAVSDVYPMAGNHCSLTAKR